MNIEAFMFGIESSIDDSSAVSTQVAYDRVGHNTGNLAFHYAISKQLGLVRRVDWSEAPSQINAAGKLAVMPCANQIGEHLDMGGMASKLGQTDVNAVAIGLGAQAGLNMAMPAVPEGTVRWVRTMADKAVSTKPNISVRGEFSWRVLESLGLGEHAVPLGCPTLFISQDKQLGRSLQSRIRKPERVCVVAGHYRWKHLSKLEASLAQLATNSGGAYVMQSPMEMIALGRGDLEGLSETFLTECRDFCRPELSVPEFVDWSHRHSRAFFNVPAWMEYMRRFDLVIGARIHGVMLALQAGVPGLCIAHDSRTLELCETMAVPYVHARDVIGGITPARLEELLQFDGDAFDATRARLATGYSQFLSDNGLEYSDSLLGAEVEL